jgi:serine/threonine protein kinase
VKGIGRYGKEIDCWSIGVILFILLSGSPPFDVSAGFDSVANAEIVFCEDRWERVSPEARDLVARLLEKDPRRRMSVARACGHAWVLMDDGDTHRHPLHDPVVISAARRGGSTMTAKHATGAIRGNPECQREQGGDMDAKFAQSSEKGGRVADDGHPKLSSSPWQTARDSVIDLNDSALNPISISDNDRKINNCEFRDIAEPAPERSGAEEKERQASIWAKCGTDHDDTVTKVIQEACHTSMHLSPKGSPIQRRQLFDEPSSAVPLANDCGIRKKKMTKQDVESINAAGNTLPTPVINDESRPMKNNAVASKEKKKKQSTLFDARGKQQLKNNAKLVMDNQGKKRKSSAVTPPCGAEPNNCSLVFRLNKKLGGKYISPEARQNAANISSNGNTEKAELSEDELCDFSDDDVDDVVKANAAVASGGGKLSEKKPLGKYLHKKRKMEGIESVDNCSEPQMTAPHSHAQQGKSRVDAPPKSISKSSTEENIHTEENLPNTEVLQEGNRRKMVQTFLFGRPPPNSEGSSNRDIGDLILPEDNFGPTVDYVDGKARTKPQAVDAGGEPQRPSGESAHNDGANTTNTAPKGRQMPITSWFQPR